MRVLIVKTSALGDIVHALPVLDYLHKVSPGIEIDWVVEEQFAAILEGNPLITGIFRVRTKTWRKQLLERSTWREIAAVKSSLQARRYDLVFDIQGNFKSGLVTWASGAKHRLGFSADELQERVNKWFTSRQIPMRPQDRHITHKYLRIVSVPFGKDFRGMALGTSIATSASEDSEAAALLATLGEGLVFLFHYGTTWQTKHWSVEGWVETGRRILERYADSTILFSWGNEAERQVVTEIARAIGTGARVMDHYPLKGLIAVLKNVDLVIGGDTGPIHLAAAVGTPTVSLYRSSDGTRSGPLGKQHIIIQSPLSCARCFRTSCERDVECRASITADMLVTAVEKLLPLKS
jgi:heptosyltransferase-1